MGYSHQQIKNLKQKHWRIKEVERKLE